MIISHRHRFIFVHLGRTGGRSLTTALADHCGPDDVITPVRGHHAGQNHHGYQRHFSARQIRKKVGENIWNDYYKFTFERNPWEKIVSRYWEYAGRKNRKAYKRLWETIAGQPLGFPNWFRMKVWQGRLLGLGHIRLPVHFGDYTQNGRVIVDFIGRNENRHQHLALLSDRLGIRIRDNQRIGADSHRVRRPYTELFDDWMQEIVERLFARDLDLLGYRFGRPHPLDPLVYENGAQTFTPSRAARAMAA